MANINIQTVVQYLKNDRFFMVDKKVFDLHHEPLSFLKGKAVFYLIAPEKAKSVEGYEKALEFMLEKGIDRKSRIVAIGGGATSDLAGFVASTILRGVDWVCVPTTLLSVIDASIGGKTGINSPKGKNLIGTFHPPAQTYICLDFLKTLSAQEMTSGRGELLKYAFLDKKVFLAIKEDRPEEELINLCRQCKNEIVRKDFKERGERKNLNLGHTFGHALEKSRGLPHGVAVAMGMEMILELFMPRLLEEFYELREKLGVSYDFPINLNSKEFWSYISKDKKKTETKIALIVPETIGRVEIRLLTLENLEEKVASHDRFKNLFK